MEQLPTCTNNLILTKANFGSFIGTHCVLSASFKFLFPISVWGKEKKKVDIRRKVLSNINSQQEKGFVGQLDKCKVQINYDTQQLSLLRRDNLSFEC